MDTGNGSKAIFSDAAGKPVSKPNAASDLASPINLLNPDRYEFYTFDDSGDLVKRLMTLDEIQGIVATGDTDGFSFDPLSMEAYNPEKRVNDIVNNVQNVLKEEMEVHKDTIDTKPLFDTPDVSSSWSMILPAIFGNSGEDIKPEKPITHVTPDTIMIEPTQPPAKVSAPTKFTSNPATSPAFHSTTVINNMVYTSAKATTPRPLSTSYTTPKSTPAADVSKVTSSEIPTTQGASSTNKFVTFRPELVSTPHISSSKSPINVEIYSHSKSTTERSSGFINNEKYPVIELTKENSRPIYHVSSSKPILEQSTSTRLPIATSSSTKHSVMASSSTRLPIITTSTTRLPMATKVASSTTTTTTTKQPAPTSSSPTTFIYMTSSSELPKITSTRLPVFNMKTTPAYVVTKMPASTTMRPRPTTTELPTTEAPINTEILQNSLPTLTELLHMNSDQQISSSSPTMSSLATLTTKLPAIKISTPEEETTPEFTTYTLVSSNSDYPTTTEFKGEATPLINQLLQDNPQSILDDDLSTLASEYVTPKRNFTKSTTEMSDTTRPVIYYTTASLPVTKQDDIPTTGILDKLLLTSTNIYEINTELSEKPTTVQEPYVEDDRFETTNSDEVTEEATPSTNTVVINLGDPTKQPSTDKNLISSIEQLISQAVGQIEDSVSNEKQNVIIQSMLDNSGQKNMSDIQMEAATIASNLMETYESNEETTTQSNILSDITADNTNILSDSVGSLLSQIYGGEDPRYTTVEGSMTTEAYTTTNIKTSTFINRKTDEATMTFDLKTTETPQTTTTLETTTTKNTEVDLAEATTTNVNNELSKNVTNETVDDYVPHIINITIISSDKKPAKSDLSQEEEFLNEELKNTTQNKIQNEILKTEATSYSDKVQTEAENEITTTELITETSEETTQNVVYVENTSNMSIGNVEVTTPEIVTAAETIQTTTLANSERIQDEEPTTVAVDVETTTIAREEPIETTTFAEIKPMIEITINENSAIRNKIPVVIPQDVTESTTVIMDDFTSSPISTLKFTTETELLTETSTNNQPSTDLLASTNLDTNTKNEDINKQSWTLVPTIAPHSESEFNKTNTASHPIVTIIDPPTPVDLVPKPLQGFGLEDSTSQLDTDIFQFAQLCNELAFGFWRSVTSGISTARSVVVSPFAASSMLAMVFLGARGATSGEMNEILKLDDMVTFNPHLIFKNISESIQTSPDSGVSVSAIVRELYSDRSKGQLLGFYKERAKQFYDGHVEEVSFKDIGDVIRRRTNLLVKKHSDGKISEFLKDSSIVVRSPLAGVSVNVFQVNILIT